VLATRRSATCGEDSEEDKPPKHAHAFGNLARLHKQVYAERVAALKQFHSEVTHKNIPDPETNISMHPHEKDKFLEALDKAWTEAVPGATIWRSNPI
jgi:3-methyl-2-oxobutanoate hydroxymethyltransferase